MKDYITVENDATSEFEVKKSRFIANVCHVENETQAFEFINRIKAQHREATHNVYAFACRENHAQRYTDDGEPAKTAGLPVLDVLLKGGITDACIVVTRYFGGTLLGTGGLVHAYGKAAKDGVIASGTVKMVYSKIFSVKTPYTFVGKIQHTAEDKDYQVLDTVFGEDVFITLSTQSENAEGLTHDITQITNGQAEITPAGERFVKKKIN